MEDKIELIEKDNAPLSIGQQITLTPGEENLIDKFADLIVDRLFQDLKKKEVIKNE